MNPGLVVKLRPSGPWRIGPDSGARNRVDVIYHSDSLYSALTSAMARMGRLEEWLDATARSATPAVCFSSCFPFVDDIGYVVPPRTVWPPPSPSLKAAPIRWKSARFIPLAMVQSILAGDRLDENRWSVDGPSGCLMPAGKQGPFRTSVRWGAAVDRLSGASERHSTACIEFRPGAGLWAVIGFSSEAARDQWQDAVKAAFRWLADTGFGGERSRGWGRSEAPEFIEGELPGMIIGETPVPRSAEVRAPREIEPMIEAASPVEEPEEPSPVPPVEPPEPEPEPGPETPPEQEPTLPVEEPGPTTEVKAEPVAAEPSSSSEQTREPAPTSQGAAAEVEGVPAATEPPSSSEQAPEPAPISPDAATEVEAKPAATEPSSSSEHAPESAPISQDAAAEVEAKPAAMEPSSSSEQPPEPAPISQDAATEVEAKPAATEPSSSSEHAPESAPISQGAAAEVEAPASTTEPAAAPEPEPSPEPAMPAAKPRAPGRPHWMLSLFTPAAADTVDWARGSYTLLSRGGRVDSPAGSGELKKQIQMIAEGSVLIAETAPRGAAPDVAPDGFAHPVFRAGFALSIPLPEGN
jgi:CRISPR type III-A-associated RAMP protein Csm4